MVEWIVFIVSAILIVAGLFMALSAVFGLFRFKFCMNRMHSAAMNDSLGILLVLAGLMLQTGWDFATLKLLLIIIFFWFASPVSGHLITKMQVIIERHNSEEKGVKSVHYEDKTQGETR